MFNITGRYLRRFFCCVGFGLNGKNLAKVLRKAGIPYAVLEMNSDTVRAMKKKGEPIYYGDARVSQGY
ncbi:MAG: NAD-binding protein [Nitrospirae bacterium]|nr:NAD-binding protein [Nitrospirota bacterium]